MYRYLFASCPRCKTKSIVQEIPAEVKDVFVHDEARYTATCGGCGQELSGPLRDLELLETKLPVRKPTSH
jgi:hypothetical protein